MAGDTVSARKAFHRGAKVARFPFLPALSMLEEQDAGQSTTRENCGVYPNIQAIPSSLRLTFAVSENAIQLTIRYNLRYYVPSLSSNRLYFLLAFPEEFHIPKQM